MGVGLPRLVYPGKRPSVGSGLGRPDRTSELRGLGLCTEGLLPAQVWLCGSPEDTMNAPPWTALLVLQQPAPLPPLRDRDLQSAPPGGRPLSGLGGPLRGQPDAEEPARGTSVLPGSSWTMVLPR